MAYQIKIDNIKVSLKPSIVKSSIKPANLIADYGASVNTNLTANTWQTVNFLATDIDENSTIGLNPPGIAGQFLIQEDGLYDLNFRFTLNSNSYVSNDVVESRFGITSGGNFSVKNLYRETTENTQSKFVSGGGSYTGFLKAGDVIECQIIHTKTGSTLQVLGTADSRDRTFVSIVKIG